MKARHLEYTQQLAEAATTGSPAAVRAVGRLLGLGAEEQAALARGGVPGWLWVVGAVLGGAVAGVRIYRRWPDKVPKLISGE